MFSGPTPNANQRLRSAVDDSNADDLLGKLYDSTILARFGGYIKLVRKSLVIGGLGVLLRTMANLATPLIIASATNRIVAGNTGGLTIIMLIYLGVILLVWSSQYLETLYLAFASQGILLKMRTQMFEHLHKLSLSFFDHNKVGKIMSRVQNDVDQLQTLVSQNFVNVSVNLITLLGIIAIMLVINWKLALLSMATLPILIVVVIIWQRRARRAFVWTRRAIAAVNDNLQESISGVRVTKNMSREAENIRRFDEINKANLDANKKAAFLQGLIMPVTQMLTDSSYVIVLIFGGFQVLNGTMDVGFLLAFLLYIQRMAQPVQQLATMYTDIQRSMASGARIFELLDVTPEIEDAPGAEEMPEVKGVITFDDVHFSYEPGVEVLHGVSFGAAPRQRVAIVGRTGAGKSSIASLVARFYEVNDGTVNIDGHNVNSVTQRSLRRQIGFVPQDPFLFSGTIEDNIRDGDPSATREQVIEAAKAAGVDDVITKLENGYWTTVGERGSTLSPGQRQLVCLARAVLADPRILILDEATSNIDTATERVLQESLDRISKGKTCLIIAHRLSTVTNADRIIVLDHGKIVESGTHAELMKQQGLYAQMFETLSRAES
jgi:ABC-type multidrug transport system fused ATPase/permease subunit